MTEGQVSLAQIFNTLINSAYSWV